MSGPKCGQVNPLLPVAIAGATALIRLIRANVPTRSTGSGNQHVNEHQASERQAEAIQRTMSSTPISATVLKHAPADAAQLEEQKKQADALIATGKREAKKANDLRSDAESLQNRAQRLLNSAGNRRQVDDAVRMEREAADQLRSALDHSRQAKNAFDSAITIGNRFAQNVSNVGRIAAERETAAKIAEENQRRASTNNSEIGGLTESINSLNHEKFAPGEFRALSSDIDSFRRAFSLQNFAEAAKIGEGLAARLRTFEQRVSALQTAFETAQIAAQNALTAAKEEIAPLDRAELIRWSGEDAVVSSAYSRLETVTGMVASEQFAEAESAVAASLEELRRLAKTADENKIASEQRYALAEVIMNALYEQGYDSPTYYYMQKKPDGSDVEFSDLAIFAKAPGDRGDMRMSIDLAGKVDLEVENIAEGEEGVCVELIQNLQKGVGNEMDFQMTDWGRGSNANPKAKVAVQTQMQTQEITRQRQG